MNTSSKIPLSRIIFYALFAVNCFAFMTSVYLVNYKPSSSRMLVNNVALNVSYEFEEPGLAYLILRQLDVYEHVDLGYNETEASKKYGAMFYETKADEEYCNKHRGYFAMRSKSFFTDKIIFTMYQKTSNLRKTVIPEIGGIDAMPHIGSTANRRFHANFTGYDLPVNLTTFFTFREGYEFRKVNKQFSCTTQMSNHIPGHDTLYRKDHVGNALQAYTNQFKDRPQCFNMNKFFPRTWVLTDKEQCLAFFKDFNSPQYEELKKERKIVYFRKIGAGVHEGKGVFPVNEEEEQTIRTKYKNGELCGQIEDNWLIQYFIHNPLLINGHKTDFRITILIASTNPFIVYYHDGFLRISIHEFDPMSTEKTALITNLNLVKDVFKNAGTNGTYHGKSEAELRNDAIWSMEKLQAYLLEHKIINDPHWLENYLRPEIKKMMVHLIRMAQGPFARRSSLFEIFGLDVMLDGDLNLWFLEGNAKPAMEGYSDEAKARFVSFQKDCFEVLYGLLRSRVKRIILYVNNLVRNNLVWRAPAKVGQDVQFDDLSKRRVEFQQVIKNRFEPEFEPSASNKLQLVINENYTGAKRYSYLIDEECA